eukprot:scaffold11563_cov146-Isochrysis_galbana.AAC.2
MPCHGVGLGQRLTKSAEPRVLGRAAMARRESREKEGRRGEWQRQAATRRTPYYMAGPAEMQPRPAEIQSRSAEMQPRSAEMQLRAAGSVRQSGPAAGGGPDKSTAASRTGYGGAPSNTRVTRPCARHATRIADRRVMAPHPQETTGRACPPAPSPPCVACPRRPSCCSRTAPYPAGMSGCTSPGIAHAPGGASRRPPRGRPSQPQGPYAGRGRRTQPPAAGHWAPCAGHLLLLEEEPDLLAVRAPRGRVPVQRHPHVRLRLAKQPQPRIAVRRTLATIPGNLLIEQPPARRGASDRRRQLGHGRSRRHSAHDRGVEGPHRPGAQGEGRQQGPKESEHYRVLSQSLPL